MGRQDGVHRMEGEGLAVLTDVVGSRGELVDVLRADLIRIARLRQDTVPHFTVRGMMLFIPLVATGRRKQNRTPGLALRLDITAEVAEARRDQRQNRVHARERRIRAPSWHS